MAQLKWKLAVMPQRSVPSRLFFLRQLNWIEWRDRLGERTRSFVRKSIGYAL